MKKIILICAVIVLCESYVVDKPKCSLSDGDCLLKLYDGFFKEAASNGIADLGIPVIDPYGLKNFNLDFLGMIRLTIVDGKVIGLKDCVSKSFKPDVQNQRAVAEYTCDTFQIEGHFNIRTLPALDALTGGIKIHGDGDGKIDIEKLHLTFDFAFEIIKGDDGEYYYQKKPEESTHDIKIDGKASISANNIFIGSQDVSQVLTAVLNENWQFAVKAIGKPVLDQAMKLFYEEVNKFFKGVPAKHLFTDDLSAYVKS